MDRTFTGYSVAKVDASFNFTIDRKTGRLILPEGVPAGTELRYIERQNFSDGSYVDSEWLTYTVK